MTDKLDVHSPETVFPGPVRHRPELFITEKGRIGVYYLVDHLLQAVCWGYDRTSPGSLSIDVKTDGTLILKRSFENEDPLFPELPPLQGPTSGSIANDMFRQCLQAINSKKFERTQAFRGNPFLLTFLAMTIALSSRAKLKLTEGGSCRVQNYKDGLAVDSVAHSKGENSGIALEAVLDSTLLAEEVRAYPFRIRVQELACLFPGLAMDIRYKGFAPLTYNCKEGMKDLVNFIVPEDDRLHPDAFCFKAKDDETTFEVSLYLVTSEMEKIKAFAGYSETYHGGVHDECLREVLSDLFQRLFKFQLPDRRQSLDNIASSRMTYFGTFGSTVPFQKENRGNQFVKIVPGVAACVRVAGPNLQWEKGANRSRLTGPVLLKTIQPELTVEFRRWLLEHAEVFNEWKQQWAPKKRRRRGTPPQQS
jgi:hypothetical protein